MTLPLEIPAEMQWMTLETQEGPREICGELLGSVDNDRRGRPRWAELELYAYIDTNPTSPSHGQRVYLLRTMGHSVVYHRADGDCDRGIVVPVEKFSERAEFPDDLEPCADEYRNGRLVPGCYPPNWKDVPIGTEFKLELLRYTTSTGLDADGAVDKLRRESKVTCKTCHGQARGYRFDCDGCHGLGYQPGPRVLSAPGGRLLEIVKPKDPGIRAAAERPERL